MTRLVLPPTARLPPIKNLNDVSLALLHEAIQYLQNVYNPEIHTSRRIIINNDHRLAPAPSTTPTGGKVEPEPESARVDAFEHAYVVRWLTALIARKTTLHDDDANAMDKDVDDYDYNGGASDLETLVQSAAALLAICAGAASAGTRTRSYVLGAGVRVQLTDVALRNDDFGSVGAQTWGSACVLAEMIAQAPARFGLHGGDGNSDDSLLCHGGGVGGHRVEGAAAIRVGCDHSRRAEIVASDFYPPVLENLRLNIQRNFPSKCDLISNSTPGLDLSISAHFLNWEEAAAAYSTTRTLGAPFDVPFDEVFGTDIVYELEHAAWIHACLKRFLRLTGRFHLVMPLREGFARESAIYV